MTQVR